MELYWKGSDTLLGADQVLLETSGEAPRQFRIEKARRADKAILLKLSGVDDRDAAARLRGAAVLVPRADLPELEPDEVYLIDLVGAQVTGPEGAIGRVVEVKAHPSVDTLVIDLGDGRLAEQPLSEGFIARIDLEAHLVELKTLDGLIV